MTQSIPVAEVQRSRLWPVILIWMIPVLALLVLAGLLYMQAQSKGPLVWISFSNAHGLRVGDALRHRGMNVGHVEVEQLVPGEGVRVAVRLRADAGHLAQRGSRFWVVRPELGIDRVSGLETLVGARYLAVDPGSGPAQSLFTGLESEPVIAGELLGGLPIVIQSQSRFGLQIGAPVRYRDCEVGRVVAVDLARDASAVEIRVMIAKRYASLVHRRSRFWVQAGVRIEAGLFDGVQVNLDSLTSLVRGGLAFATPQDSGGMVASGHRFDIAAKPDKDWLDWRPSLPLGGSQLPASRLPPVQSASLAWQTGKFFKSDKRQTAWALPLASGYLVPAALVTRPEKARDDSVRFEVEGEVLPIEGQVVTLGEHLALYKRSGLSAVLPFDRLRAATTVEDIIVVGGDGSEKLVASARMQEGGERWIIEDGQGLGIEWHGACVMSTADACCVGLLLVDDDGVYVQTLTQAMTALLTGVAKSD